MSMGATLLAGGAIMAAAYPPALYLTGRYGELTSFVNALRNKAAAA